MIYPSATQILQAHGYYSSMDAAGAANQTVGFERGSALHKAMHWLGYGKEPEWREPHPELDGFLDGYRKFKKEHNWMLAWHEREFISETNRCRAHPDQLGHFQGDLGQPANIEIKTGALPNFVHLQTALQNLAMEDISLPRYCLHLPGDGSYRLIHHNDVRDFAKARVLISAMWIRAETQGAWWCKEQE